MKNIVLLGATGSIGQSALNVLRQNSDSFNLLGIAFNNNFDIALDIANEFKPDFIFYSANVTSKDHPLFSFDAEILSRSENLREMIQHPKVDVVISAVSGFAGLEASYFAIDAGKIILVANKESIVSAGDLLIPLADKKNTTIVPIDSEHNAIHQCLLVDNDLTKILKLLITASGGPFKELSMEELKHVSIQDALKHPTWVMGPKITIDSATLVNKCLELIEANYLFDIPESKIDIAVHPQSIVHSMITFIDGSTIAHLSNPKMEVPIANALGLEGRLPIQFDELDFSSLELTFEPIPEGRESIFQIAREVCRNRGNLGTIFNAANEIAVQAFIDQRINFVDIYEVVIRTFSHFSCSNIKSLEEIFEYDKQARIQAEKVIKSIN
tara:strand:+ start:92 stop:1243 length:1152 start_codon:yes stop_codon:yes gene_type:complete